MTASHFRFICTGFINKRQKKGYTIGESMINQNIRNANLYLIILL